MFPLIKPVRVNINDLTWDDNVIMLKFEDVVDALYEGCSVRSRTTKEVFNYIINKLTLIGANNLEEKAIEIIRPYKQSGKNLEFTAKELYTLLDSTRNTSGSTWG